MVLILSVDINLLAIVKILLNFPRSVSIVISFDAKAAHSQLNKFKMGYVAHDLTKNVMRQIP